MSRKLGILAGAAIVLAGCGGDSESRPARGSLSSVRIADVRHVPPPLRAAQRRYAHTLVFEDAYLSSLAAAIPDRAFDDLPDTQDRRRSAIIAWRIAVESMAARQDLKLPADLKTAGRGEIAPSPDGS